MNYLDASFATALLFNVRGQTGLAEKFLRRNSLPLILSELAELECHRAFVIRTGQTDSDNWSHLQRLLEDRSWKRDAMLWSTVTGKARQLIERYGFRLRAGTLDTLHVAHALLSGCTCFLSFDSNSNARVLASSCRLQVFPELSVSEKSRDVRRLRKRACVSAVKGHTPLPESARMSAPVDSELYEKLEVRAGVGLV